MTPEAEAKEIREEAAKPDLWNDAAGALGP